VTSRDAEHVGALDLAEEVGSGDEAVDRSPSVEAVTDDTRNNPVRSRSRLLRTTGYALLPVLIVTLTAAAGYFKYEDFTSAETARVRAQSVQIATDATVDLLSYTPDNAESKLTAASQRLTGAFRDSYLSLVHNVVIPGAQQKRISAKATVPAASSVSASPDSAKVVVFVNQTVTVGNGGPTDTASVVEVDLEKVDGRWLISGFDPR
jgi:Mce-associated membrane protein